jgi:integrase
VYGHARANRHKPSGIAATESIVKWHLAPTLGTKRLDAITNEQVQKLKLAMAQRAPKTVNNVLTVLSTLLKKAVEWGELEKVPCTIKLLANPKKTMGFHDFDEYERLLTVAQKRSRAAYVMVLLGGDAGLRLGEIVALEGGRRPRGERWAERRSLASKWLWGRLSRVLGLLANRRLRCMRGPALVRSLGRPQGSCLARRSIQLVTRAPLRRKLRLCSCSPPRR